MYLQQKNNIPQFSNFSYFTFVLIEQTQIKQQIDNIEKVQQLLVQEQSAFINPQQLLKKGLYLKYFRQKQRSFYKDPNQTNQFDSEEDKFIDIHVYGLKHHRQYNVMNADFLKFLYQVIYHEKSNYDWVNIQKRELFLLRSLEIFYFEDNFQKERKDSIQFQIIRQNRVKVYCHYYYFTSICQRYQMESYQKLLNNQLVLTEPSYKKCIFQFISSFIGVEEEQLNQYQITALNEYFKPLVKPECKRTFLQKIQTIIQKINYEPPMLDHNPNIGLSLDENIRIEDALQQLTNYWMQYGPFYDIHLTKQALYDAKYIIFLYNKYSTQNLDTIIDSINFQLVQN